jgi:hypothetical protein
VEFVDLSDFHDGLVTAKTFFEGVPSQAEAPAMRESAVSPPVPRAKPPTSSPQVVVPPTTSSGEERPQHPVPFAGYRGLEVRSLLVGAVVMAAILALLAAILG